MCVICYMPAGITPTEDQLDNACLSNPDGFGFIVRTDDGLITGRSMSHDRAVDRFLDLRAKHPQHDAAFHARITTHGKTVIDNNHPFRVGDKRTALMHNGMLPIDVPKGDDRSDTRVFAEDRLTKMGLAVLDNKKQRRALEKWMTGSKVVIMSVRDDLKRPTYILNEADGLWDDGIWWSNSSYDRAPSWTRWSKDYTHWWEAAAADEDEDYFDDGMQCLNPACGIVWTKGSKSAKTGICRSCYNCLDCGYGSNDCWCDPMPTDNRFTKMAQGRA